MGERSETTAKRCVQVVLSWGGTAQSMIEVAPGGRVVIGDRAGATFLLPSEHVPEAFTLIDSDERGGLALSIPAGAIARLGRTLPGDAASPEAPSASARTIALQPGDHAELELGPFTLHVTETERSSDSTPRARRDFAGWRWIGASLAFHAAFLASLFFMPPNAGALSFDLSQADREYIQVRLDAMSRETIVAPPLETGVDGSSAPSSEGQTAAEEEGTVGAPTDTRRTGGGVRVRGTSADRRVPLTAAAVADSAVVRMAIGLSAMLRPVSSPYGAEQAQGFAIDEAYGDLMANAPGFSGGFNGLGMNGTGHGGGCERGEPCAVATIGVGDLSTGIGRGTTCSAREFGAIERAQGHAAAVTACGPGALGNGGVGTGVLAGRGRNGRVPGALRVGTPEVLGGLAREQIRRVVSRNRAQIQHCYEQGLVQRPDLAGRVTVQWVIHQEGRVASASITGSEMNDAQVERCMTQAVSRWQFPSSPGVTGVSYPFVFSSTN
jgi:TonB family protein